MNDAELYAFCVPLVFWFCVAFFAIACIGALIEKVFKR